MYTKCNLTNIINGVEAGTIGSRTDYCHEVINYFESFLKKIYKGKYTVNICLNNVEQYIDWYYLNNMDDHFILNNKNYNKYAFYLQNTKGYKKSTILSKIVSLRKLNKFLINLNQGNNNEQLSNHSKINNRNNYNYLTESYIKL